DAHVRVTGNIDHHRGAGRGFQLTRGRGVIVDRHHGVSRRRVGKRWRIRNNNRPESLAAPGADQIKTHHEPKPEKPLHSNSVEKIVLRGKRYCIGNWAGRGNRVEKQVSEFSKFKGSELSSALKDSRPKIATLRFSP